MPGKKIFAYNIDPQERKYCFTISMPGKKVLFYNIDPRKETNFIISIPGKKGLGCLLRKTQDDPAIASGEDFLEM
jgi:hypothetical protein